MKEVALLVLALLPSSSLQLPPASVRLKEYQVRVEQARAEAERTLKHTIDFNLKQSREPLPKAGTDSRARTDREREEETEGPAQGGTHGRPVDDTRCRRHRHHRRDVPDAHQRHR